MRRFSPSSSRRVPHDTVAVQVLNLPFAAAAAAIISAVQFVCALHMDDTDDINGALASDRIHHRCQSYIYQAVSNTRAPYTRSGVVLMFFRVLMCQHISHPSVHRPATVNATCVGCTYASPSTQPETAFISFMFMAVWARWQSCLRSCQPSCHFKHRITPNIR